MSPTANLERRKTGRRRPPSLIYVEMNPNNGGMMRDLSEDGFALRAMMPLTVGDNAGFSFVLHGGVRIEGEGEVIWIEEKGKVAGIRFTNVSDHDRAELQNWLSQTPEIHNGKQAEESSAEPSRQSWNQLRDELLSSPSRPQSAESKWDRETPRQSSDDRKQPAVNQEREHGKDPILFPGPSGHSPQEHVESSFESRSPGSKAAHEQSRSTADAQKAGQPAAHPVLPDISKILMQPPNKASNYPPKAFEPLDPLAQSRELSERRGGWFTLSRAVIIMGVLALGVAGFAYHEFVGEGLIWLGQQVSGPQMAPPAPAPASPPATAPSTPSTKDQLPQAQTSGPAPKPTDTTAAEPAPATPATAQQNANPSAVQSGNDVSEALPPVTRHTQAQPAARSTDTSSESTSDTNQGPGMTEYSEAVRLLHGKSGTADPAEAARLLWISVEKGNSDAELTLAELYWHGEGVARNCDQARILLGAAVRKGNLAARTRLSEFEREGCE